MVVTVAIVWPCPDGVEVYAAAGRGVVVPRPACPGCGGPMVFWSGYRRWVRASRARRMWVRRAKCRRCRVTHALLPSFVLLRRVDAVEVIGGVLEGAVAGAGLRGLAAVAGVPHTTARDWRRRFRARAPTLVAGLAGLAGLAVALGGVAPALPADPQGAALAALVAAWEWACRRRGGRQVPGRWGFAAVVSGGGWLGATTPPPWATAGAAGWLPPVP